MDSSVIQHTHAITSATDFQGIIIVIGAAWAIFTGLLVFISILCGIIYRNTKDGITQNIDGIGDLVRSETKTRIAVVKEIWDHIDNALWEAIESCCPRMSPDIIAKLREKMRYQEATLK
jgi:hypothetical protein